MVPAIVTHPEVLLHMHEVVQGCVDAASVGQMCYDLEVEGQVLQGQLHKTMCAHFVGDELLS